MHLYSQKSNNNEFKIFQNTYNIYQPNTDNYCCCIVKKDNEFELYNRYCRYCDNDLHKYTCDLSYSNFKSKEENKRECLMKIQKSNIDFHSTKIITTKIQIPSFNNVTNKKHVWCKRTNQIESTTTTITSKLPNFDKITNILSLHFDNNGSELKYLPSKRNFILENSEKEIISQFSKIDKKQYELTIYSELSIIEAFGVIISYFSD